MRRVLVVLSSLPILLALAGPAAAKGEGGGISGFCFGQDALAANTVRFPDGQADTIVASTNFGILLSRDAGATYGWVCPQVYGAQIAGNFTLFALPGVVALPDGTIFVLSGGLGYWISSEEACRYESAPDDDLRAATVVSVASRPLPEGVVLAALSWPGREPFGVFRSEDFGRQFAATELQSDGRLRFGSVHLTPGGERAYVTTRTEEQLIGVWHSDDGYTGWVPGDAELSAVSATVAASRAGNPDEVFLETTVAITGACEFDVAVLRSDDAADTFTLVQQREEILVGVVVDDEGAVWMGWKDTGMEVWRDGVVEPVEGSPAPIGCLSQAPNGDLAVCPLGDPGALVTVRDAETGAFEPLVTTDRITGPLDCPADTPVGRECGERYREIASFWGLPNPGPGLDGGSGDPDAGPGRDGGGDDGDDGGIPPGSDLDGDDGDGCSCRAAGSARQSPASFAGLALLAVVLLVRRMGRRILAPATAVVLAACPSDETGIEGRPIVWSLDEQAFWPDSRDLPGVGEGRIVITNNLDDTVSLLDLALVGDDALSELVKVPVGFIPVEREGPHHLAADPSGEFYYVGISNFVPGAGSGPHGVHGSGSADGHVLKIRASDNLAVAAVRVDRNPGDLEITPDGSRLFVTHFDMLRITETIAAGGDERDMDSRLAILDPVTMERVAMVPACPAAHGIVISPDARTAYVSCLPDQIAIIDVVSEDHPVRRVPVVPVPGPVSAPRCSPYALTISPSGDTVWVSCYADGSVLPYDVASGEMAPDRAAGPFPGPTLFGAFTRDGGTLFVPHQGAGGIGVVDPDTGEIVDDVFLPPETCFAPHVVRLTDDEERLMVVCEGDRFGPGTFVVLDRATMSVERAVPLGIFPDDVGILRPPPS
jgi:MYXO-CTERM domain-containing protein